VIKTAAIHATALAHVAPRSNPKAATAPLSPATIDNPIVVNSAISTGPTAEGS